MFVTYILEMSTQIPTTQWLKYPSVNSVLPYESRDIIFEMRRNILSRKVKVKVNFTVEQATKAHRGRRDIALLFL